MAKQFQDRNISSRRAARRLALLLGTGAVMATPLPSGAANWNGTLSTDWDVAGNWSTNAVPTAADPVTIDGAPFPTIQSGVNAVAGFMTVGTAAPTTLLFIDGSLATTSGVVALNAGSGAQIFVGVGGASWTSTNSVEVGILGFGLVSVAGGGLFSAGDGILIGSGSGGGTVVASGANARVMATELAVGIDGNGQLNVQFGGHASSVTGTGIGGGVGSGSALVEGDGSSLDVGTDLLVGYGGVGTLKVSQGGLVTVAAKTVLGQSTGTDGTITVTGLGALDPSGLAVGGDLVVGQMGRGTLNVEAGGAVLAMSGMTRIGEGAGSTGAVTVTGTGSTLGFMDMAVGALGTGALTVADGGTVVGGSVYIGSAGGEGHVLVTGTDARLMTLAGTEFRVGNGGTGSLTIANGGTVAIGSGGVTVGFGGGAGALNIGAAAGQTAAGAGVLQADGVDLVAGSGVLNFNHTDASYVFAPRLLGGGTVRQLAGNTVLNTDSPTFSGAVEIGGGRLAVNGVLGGSVDVATGGTLGGTGTVGNTSISGGTLAPGNSIGTLNVNGNLVFTSASTYMVEIDPATSDRVNVSGTATLGGATVSAIYANGSYVARRYTIVNASGGVSGTFSALVNTNLPANFTPSLNYDANNAYLDLTLGFASSSSQPPGFPGGLTINQDNVARALVNSFNAAGGIPLAFGALTPAGLTQASGEAATATQQATFSAMDRFINLVTEPFAGRLEGSTQHAAPAYNEEAAGSGHAAAERDAYAALPYKAHLSDFRNRWSAWATGYGGSQTLQGDAAVGSATTTSRIYGTAAGADYRVTPNTMIGFALGGAGTNFSLANGLGHGSSDMFQAGIYARHVVGSAYLAGALAYGWQDVTTDRTVLGADRLRGRFETNAFSGRIEGGYRFATGWMGITPYAAGQATTLELPRYAEQVVAGGNLFALSYDQKDVTASRSELGLRTDKSLVVGDALMILRGRAAWAHDFNTDRRVAATFQALPATAFVVNGAAQAHDTALVTAAAELKWMNGFSLSGSFEGEFSNRSDSYAGKGTVRYQW